MNRDLTIASFTYRSFCFFFKSLTRANSVPSCDANGNPLTSFSSEVLANLSLQHRRPFDRNNRSNIYVCNNRQPSDSRLIYSIEVSIRGFAGYFRDIYGKPLLIGTPRQRASYRRITKSVDISRHRRHRSISATRKTPGIIFASRCNARHVLAGYSMHRLWGGRRQQRVSAQVAPVEFI